jgi:hypothetical protein
MPSTRKEYFPRAAASEKSLTASPAAIVSTNFNYASLSAKKKSFPNIDAAALCDSSDRRRIQPVAWLTSKHFETEQTMGFYIPIR